MNWYSSKKDQHPIQNRRINVCSLNIIYTYIYIYIYIALFYPEAEEMPKHEEIEVTQTNINETMHSTLGFASKLEEIDYHLSHKIYKNNYMPEEDKLEEERKLEEKKGNKNKIKSCLCIIIFLLLLSLGINIYLMLKNMDLSKEIEQRNSEKVKLYKDNQLLIEEKGLISKKVQLDSMKTDIQKQRIYGLIKGINEADILTDKKDAEKLEIMFMKQKIEKYKSIIQRNHYKNSIFINQLRQNNLLLKEKNDLIIQYLEIEKLKTNKIIKKYQNSNKYLAHNINNLHLHFDSTKIILSNRNQALKIENLILKDTNKVINEELFIERSKTNKKIKEHKISVQQLTQKISNLQAQFVNTKNLLFNANQILEREKGQLKNSYLLLTESIRVKNFKRNKIIEKYQMSNQFLFHRLINLQTQLEWTNNILMNENLVLNNDKLNLKQNIKIIMIELKTMRKALIAIEEASRETVVLYKSEEELTTKDILEPNFHDSWEHEKYRLKEIINKLNQQLRFLTQNDQILIEKKNKDNNVLKSELNSVLLDIKYLRNYKNEHHTNNLIFNATGKNELIYLKGQLSKLRPRVIHLQYQNNWLKSKIDEIDIKYQYTKRKDERELNRHAVNLMGIKDLHQCSIFESNTYINILQQKAVQKNSFINALKDTNNLKTMENMSIKKIYNKGLNLFTLNTYTAKKHIANSLFIHSFMKVTLQRKHNILEDIVRTLRNELILQGNKYEISEDKYSSIIQKHQTMKDKYLELLSTDSAKIRVIITELNLEKEKTKKLKELISNILRRIIRGKNELEIAIESKLSLKEKWGILDQEYQRKMKTIYDILLTIREKYEYIKTIVILNELKQSRKVKIFQERTILLERELANSKDNQNSLISYMILYIHSLQGIIQTTKSNIQECKREIEDKEEVVVSLANSYYSCMAQINPLKNLNYLLKYDQKIYKHQLTLIQRKYLFYIVDYTQIIHELKDELEVKNAGQVSLAQNYYSCVNQIVPLEQQNYLLKNDLMINSDQLLIIQRKYLFYIVDYTQIIHELKDELEVKNAGQVSLAQNYYSCVNQIVPLEQQNYLLKNDLIIISGQTAFILRKYRFFLNNYSEAKHIDLPRILSISAKLRSQNTLLIYQKYNIQTLKYAVTRLSDRIISSRIKVKANLDLKCQVIVSLKNILTDRSKLCNQKIVSNWNELVNIEEDNFRIEKDLIGNNNGLVRIREEKMNMEASVWDWRQYSNVLRYNSEYKMNKIDPGGKKVIYTELSFIAVHNYGIQGYFRGSDGNYKPIFLEMNRCIRHFIGDYNPTKGYYVSGGQKTALMYNTSTFEYTEYTGNLGRVRACAWQSSTEFVCVDDGNDRSPKNNQVHYFTLGNTASTGYWQPDSATSSARALLVLQSGNVIFGDKNSKSFYRYSGGEHEINTAGSNDIRQYAEVITNLVISVENSQYYVLDYRTTTPSNPPPSPTILDNAADDRYYGVIALKTGNGMYAVVGSRLTNAFVTINQLKNDKTKSHYKTQTLLTNCYFQAVQELAQGTLVMGGSCNQICLWEFDNPITAANPICFHRQIEYVINAFIPPTSQKYYYVEQ